ncbi:MAG: ATP-binding cassette domain-containing protein [Nitrosopumilaceae archaeon]|nr:ATP-binding cassette domain-containing protein [Nitrosopumilaceae archaeon]NIU00256.1 ATP-binding cassette domain-containing protein [Nitrosopumilaceae archaeon]NIU86668.1 ATP-binding cassette domain-containing protein [Nitrosopumilaceae archaeon]NIV65363.1 ATP-binding cassette domain-containing protein [Nitrosopumilaceae archaeon]NIX60858.1 ATP-binding cassette domain-containing protein [Nitrosopumilaceae archaeon]
MTPTGIKTLDNLLNGGIKKGTVVDIFGANGTGKTQLCQQISINHLKNGGKVMFQDTTGEFRPERMVQLLKEKGLDESLLDNVSVSRITNTSNQIEAISNLKLESNSLVVIDSLTDLFSFEYTNEKLFLDKTIRFMNYLSKLSSLAVKKLTPFVVTNMIRTVNGSSVENMANATNLFTHFKIFLSKEKQYFLGTASWPFGSNSFKYKIHGGGLEEIT